VKPSGVPAVRLPPAGASYRPSREALQELSKQAKQERSVEQAKKRKINEQLRFPAHLLRQSKAVRSLSPDSSYYVPFWKISCRLSR
jgi:hypothetical protein